MKITVLAGGVGGARFVRGLLHHLPERLGAQSTPEVTVIGNTGDDITLFGLRVCPDLDTLMYTLGGGIDDDQGWGRAHDSRRVQDELAAYGATPQWFTLGDLDIGTHIARSQWLGQGQTLSEVTDRLSRRWGLPERGVRLLPMSDDPVETHVVIDDDQSAPSPVGPSGPTRAVHFQHWWVGMRAAVTARRFVAVGVDRAVPAPGVLDAVRSADVVLLPPSNPVVSIGIILAVPGIRDALRGTPAPVVGVSPIIAGRPVRGYADTCLSAIGVPSTAEAVAGLYEDFLDAWLVDPADAQATARARVVAHRRSLLMDDLDAAAGIAGHALDLAERVPTG